MSEFFAMGGYGFYVWGAYGVTALALVVELIALRSRRRMRRRKRAAGRRRATRQPRMKPRHRRFAWIGAGVVVLGAAVALVLNAFQSNLVFFFTPSQVVAEEAPAGPAVPHRRAGRVGKSLMRISDALDVKFVVTDTAQRLPVVYTGLLPDLFKEGKGVVAQGSVGPDGVFHATEVLAKHDENYMPPEAARPSTRRTKTRGMDKAAKTLKHMKRRRPMIPELGQFRADPRAPASALAQGTLPLIGAQRGIAVLDGARRPPAARCNSLFVAIAVRLSRVVASSPTTSPC